MRHALLFCLCALAFAPALAAQHRGVAAHSLYAEIGGFGGAYSLNYDHLLPTGVVLRAGVTNGTLCGWVGDCHRTVAVPLGASYLLAWPLGASSADKWVEVGMGLVVGVKGEAPNTGVGVETDPFVSLAALVGLRRQPIGRGFTYRVAFTPLLTLGEKGGYPPGGFDASAGIALGYAF